ncbi:MAG: DNA-binding winged helix-turn-helix (wHTH) protein/Tol biopolymer transport system component [Alteromonadaceae bacterium]|jgi:DNA-binding winged helix-turn-helix (wHTH) protein/Tol biopolymer transport system component
MTEKNIFYITDFKIDLSRSVVIKGEHQTQVEPKVLQVLLLLAKRQNEVVTHKEIMGHIWQGAEVVPNALQRCITILRKVLIDDAKAPTIIATHPRIGYRLLAEVRWQSLPDLQAVTDKKNTKQHKSSVGKFAIPLLILVALVLVTTGVFWTESLPSQYTKIRQLTQTDARETHVLFSPNTKYIVFNRYAGSCQSHLWARHVESGKENRLTAQSGYYGGVSFTGDGRELVFAAKKHCDLSNKKQVKKANNQLCWNIATLDFALSLSTPQMPSFRHQCQAERLETPKSLPNHQYAFLQYNDGFYQLMHYDDLSKELTSIYNSEELYIYHFDYDPLHNRFALISRDNHSNNVLQILDEKGKLLSHEIIELAQGMSRNQYFTASFEPRGEYLLATSTHKLYKIDLNGQLQAVTTPENNLISVAKHPKNNNLLAVKGNKDIDIAQITLGEKTLTQAKSDLNNQKLLFTNLARSTAQERNALYQPNGELLAFISDRSGQDQLWLWRQSQGQGQASQLTFAANQTKIHNFSWSPDGKYLAWVSNDRLTITDLNGKIQVYDTEKPLYSILSWYADNQLLVLLNDPQPRGMYRFDIDKDKLTPYGINQVESAWVHHKQLIYSDVDGEVFTRFLDDENIEIKRLSELNGKALFRNEQFIYSVDQDSFILNQYTLQGQFIKAIIRLEAKAWKVSGLKGNQLLLSQFIAINHDIVMLQ